jgi:hypothetical protein
MTPGRSAERLASSRERSLRTQEIQEHPSIETQWGQIICPTAFLRPEGFETPGRAAARLGSSLAWPSRTPGDSRASKRKEEEGPR